MFVSKILPVPLGICEAHPSAPMFVSKILPVPLGIFEAQRSSSLSATVATLEVVPQNGFSTGFIRLTAVQPGQADVGVTVGFEGLSTAATVIAAGSDGR